MEVRTRTHDLSGKSIRFSTSQELQIGSHVELILMLSGWGARQGDLRVSCAGQVIRCSKWQATPDIVVGLETFRFIRDKIEADEFDIRRKIFFGL